jgi:fumarate hydratase subunit beta
MDTEIFNVPFSKDRAKDLKAGMQLLLSGTVYTARDAAHKRLCELIAENKPLPVDLNDAVIYFCGPAPAKPGMVIGSAGPTTSYRMDAYSPVLMEKAGIRAMIGKGNRNEEVVNAMKEHSCVYFAATGGLGALLAKCITSCETAAFEDLGPEALRKLTVEKFPVIVAIDAFGNNMYSL